MHISFVPSRSVQAPFFDTICFKGTWAAFPLWGNIKNAWMQDACTSDQPLAKGDPFGDPKIGLIFFRAK